MGDGFAVDAGAPLVEGRLTKVVRAAKLFDGHARVSLFVKAEDSLIGKPGLFYGRYSPKVVDFVPSR